MKDIPRILIVEDLTSDYELAQREIRKSIQNCTFERVERQSEFLRALKEFQPHVILSDYQLPAFTGMEALELVQQHLSSTPLIVWTGAMSEDVAVDCMKKGASNYILKENMKRLGPAVIHALEERRLSLERKQAEDALIINEMRFRSLIENGLDDISLLDADGKLIWESPSTVRNLGYSPNQFVGQSIFAIMHPDDLGWATELFKELIQKPGSRQHQSFRLQRSDGTWRWVEAITTNMLNEPSVQAIIVNYRDVTERIQTEQALRESEEKYRLLFESNPMPMWIYDLETLKFLKVNNAAVEHYGYSVEDFLGMTIKDIRPSEDVPKLLENIALSGISIHQWMGRSGIWRHRKKDGAVILVDIISHLVEFEGRKAELVLAKDVTEHKQAEQKLLESQAKYRNLVETSHDLIWAVDEEGKITFLNRAAKDIYGYEPEELIGRSFFEIITPAHYHLNPKDFKEAIAGINESQSVETYVRHRDGRQIILSANSIVTRDEDGNVMGVTGSSRNITESRQTELERQVLLEIMQGLANTSDLQAFLKLIHGAIAKVVHAENFFVVFRRPDNGLFEEIYTVDQYDSPAEPSMLEKSITSYVFRSAEPLLLTQERFKELVEQGEIELVGTTSASWLGVPLKTANGVIGVMAVQDYHDPKRYTERDKNFLASIESQVALAVERKRAEELLRESEERFSNAFEYAPIGKALVTLDGKWFRVNHAICDMVGYSAEELLRKTFQDITHPDDLESDLNLVGQVLAGKIDSYQMEKRYIHKMGHMIWVLLGVSLVRDNEGKPLYFISQIQDITERKQVEVAEREQRALAEALRDTAETLNSTLDYGEVLDRILTAVGRVVPHNAATIMLIDGNSAQVVRSHGYDKHGFGTEIREIRLPLTETDNLREMLETRQPVIVYDTHSYTGWKRLSSTDWLCSNVGAPISIYGQVIGFILLDSEKVGFFTPAHARRLEAFANQAAIAIHNSRLLQQAEEEIAERKRAEAELRTSDERFRQLANNIQEVFWMTDVETGRRIYISPAGEKIWGQSLDYMMNEPNAFINTIFVEDKPAVLSALEKEKRGEKGEVEYRVVSADGSVHWVWDRAFPISGEDGRVKTLAGIAADITERKNAEFETQRHLTEMEALYENGLAVGQLLKQEEIGNRIIETFARHLSWHHVAIRLLRPETDELELVAFNLPGLDDQDRLETEQHFNKTINKVGRGLSGWVVQTREPLRTGNVHSHPQYVDTQAGIESGLYMPLKIGEHIIGVISVESDRPDAFTAQDERLLATLASQAAVAFENARLYQKIQLELAERKKAEDALRASETHYRDLADSITDILFEIDHDLRYIHWNKASELFSGIPAAAAIGKSVEELFGNSEDSLRPEDIYRSVLRERKAKMFQTEIIPGGHTQKRILEINAYPSARGVSVVAKDVTERKRNETLLENRFELMEYSAHHDLNAMMQKAVDLVCELTGSHIGFYFLVDDDEKTLKMQTCSVETMLMFNVPQSEGMHLALDQAGVWAEAARQRRSVIHNDYDLLAQKKGLPEGHFPIKRELIVPIIRNEKLVALIGVGNKESDYIKEDVEIVERFVDYAWDITERKQMEIQLADERVQLARRVEERTADLSRANSNLARALRVKDEFLANMSHELRTPLNAILGLSESLGEQVAGPLNEKQQKYLTTINESGHHLLSLINDILDLAKIEAGQITLDINKVDVNSVCQASLRMVKQLAQKKNQDVVLEIDDDLGLMWADERRLKQMIVNLLSNAVKFTPEAGRLGLEVHGDRNGNKVTLTVWDNGIGISSGDMERLFRPFVQLDSGLAREATGTGLGLALVAQMARLHGGSVTVQSLPGEGSRFSIQLPWEPALASDAAIRLRNTGKFPAIDPLAKNKPTILLIEDTKEVVMMLMDYLEMAGYKVVTAQDGIDGIAQAKLSHPNLILMDIQMPRMDGFETTRKLRSDPEFKDIPIIALTALAMSDDRERCLAAGMNEYISKPVNLKALVRLIRQFLFESKESTPS